MLIHSNMWMFNIMWVHTRWWLSSHCRYFLRLMSWCVSCLRLQVVGGLDIHKKMVVDVWASPSPADPLSSPSLTTCSRYPANALCVFQWKYLSHFCQIEALSSQRVSVTELVCSITWGSTLWAHGHWKSISVQEERACPYSFFNIYLVSSFLRY